MALLLPFWLGLRAFAAPVRLDLARAGQAAAVILVVIPRDPFHPAGHAVPFPEDPQLLREWMMR
eukprot:11226966-Lingulodinium_polyedra.AAC.1